MTSTSLKNLLKLPPIRLGLLAALCCLRFAVSGAPVQINLNPSPLHSTAATTPTAHAAPASKPAEDPGFFLDVQPHEATIGDPVILHLQTKDPHFKPERIEEITFNPDEKQWHLDASWRRDWRGKDDGKPNPWYATLRPFDTGTLVIPTTKVSYRTTDGKTAEATVTTTTLTVKSIRPADAKQPTLIPLRDPAAIPRDLSWIWATLLILVLCTLGGWALLRWWDRRHHMAMTPPAEPELPPGLWALRELDQRSRLQVCQTGPAKPIFSHASEVVRLYLGRRYGVMAIDMTTLECLHALHALHLDEEVLRWIKDFLEECDMVKFTTHEPARKRWRTIWHDARLIVKMTTPESELSIHGATEAPFAREVAR